MWWHHDGFGWFAVFGGLFWLILLGSIIYLIVSVLAPDRGPGHREEEPLEIAKRRYAKGEITREEFQQIRQDLTSRPPPG
ncbi:MAG TPA: SHOCT domain-containing protein [Dehalococcoidia bacterium]|nr:SHOCT domain-containing protein [Dehalococcoidia bacterium]